MNGAIVGIGIDLVRISRVREALGRWADRFLSRVLSQEETAYCRARVDPAPHVAARFAAKEAAMKALGVGWAGASWREFEVVNTPSGQPLIRFSGRAAQRLANLGADTAFVSMTHDGDYAAAQVVLSRTAPSPL
ncbi:MAG TPA: holo-ACP synthase [Nitrospiria bacterium]|nr:holo-ACP synthase [Nitrospiria bacterium]